MGKFSQVVSFKWKDLISLCLNIFPFYFLLIT